MFTSSYFHIYFIQKRKDIIWERQIALVDASDSLSRPSELPCSICLSVDTIVCWCFQLSMLRFFCLFCFYFCISYQGVFDSSKVVCAVLDISEYYTLRFYFHYLSLLAQSVNILVYWPVNISVYWPGPINIMFFIRILSELVFCLKYTITKICRLIDLHVLSII